MTIKPYGYALWENIVRIFDGQLKDYGIQNCAFPLHIPVSFLAKEAEHVEGFAKECAVVTHYRLEADADNSLRPAPAAELEEPYVVRPTSETIIGDAMSRWVQSYRDLPLKLNQWGSVMRWEMRTRMFLRTSEFFWHEGHCAFADHDGAELDCVTIQDMYAAFFEKYLALPGVKGIKTPDERFPGAVETNSIETVMQDGKALQAATSHNLGQNFSKSCGIKFQSKAGKEAFAYTTSWAFSSRIIGAIIMVHGDDDGMIMPPRIAPQQIAVIPVVKGGEQDAAIVAACDGLAARVKAAGYRAQVDAREMRMSEKIWDSIRKGVPIRIEIGQREIETGMLSYTRRDLGKGSKVTQSMDEFVAALPGIVQSMHDDMLAKASDFMNRQIADVASLADLREHFAEPDKSGLVRIDLDLIAGNPDFDAIKKEFAVTTRCIPFSEEGRKVLVGRAY
jgi:prolyl-tRNA synthetase